MSKYLPRFLLLLMLALTGCASTGTINPTNRPSANGDQAALYAMSMIGKPYRWGGTSPKAGFDCSGLAHYAWAGAADVKLPRVAAQMSRVGRKIGRSRLLPGDLVFFNTQRRRYSHVGVYVGNDRFVHAPSRGKKIRLARLDNPYWYERYNGARRPDIE